MKNVNRFILQFILFPPFLCIFVVAYFGLIQTAMAEEKWDVGSSTNSKDGTTTVVMLIFAKHSIFKAGYPPLLGIGCKSKKTNLFVAPNTRIGIQGLTKVNYRTKKGGKKTENWKMVRKYVYFQGDPVPLIKQLMESETFSITIKNGHLPKVKARFKLRNMSMAIKPLRKACGW